MPGLTLGQRLRQARQERGLTQEALAKPDLTKGFISLLEHDRAKPSVQTLERLAQRLGKPISYFLGDSEAPVAQRILDVLGSRGRAELARRRYEAALGVFTEMRQVAMVQRNSRMETHAILGVGEALVGLRRLKDARTHLQDALDRGRADGDTLVECRALHGLATVEHRHGRFTRAVALYRAALNVAGTLGGTEGLLHGEIWLYLGTVLGRMGRMEEALEAYTQARQIFEEVSHPERVGEALLGLGNILSSSGEHDAALLQYERARVLFEQYEDLQMTAYVRNNLGMLLMQLGRAQDALEHFSVSLAIKQRLRDAVGESRTLTELARCYFICGERNVAKEFAEQAVARSREAGAPDEEARAQIVLGSIAAESGDFKTAQRLFHLAAQQCERSSMALELVTIFRELARLASLQGHYKEATAYHEKVFAALRRVGPHDVLAALYMAEMMGRPGVEPRSGAPSSSSGPS